MFGRELNDIITTLGMTQKEFAQKTGLTQAAISMILDGKREPSLGTIIKIIRVIPIKFERLAKEELGIK